MPIGVCANVTPTVVYHYHATQFTHSTKFGEGRPAHSGCQGKNHVSEEKSPAKATLVRCRMLRLP